MNKELSFTQEEFVESEVGKDLLLRRLKTDEKLQDILYRGDKNREYLLKYSRMSIFCHLHAYFVHDENMFDYLSDILKRVHITDSLLYGEDSLATRKCAVEIILVRFNEDKEIETYSGFVGEEGLQEFKNAVFRLNRDKKVKNGPHPFFIMEHPFIGEPEKLAYDMDSCDREIRYIHLNMNRDIARAKMNGIIVFTNHADDARVVDDICYSSFNTERFRTPWSQIIRTCQSVVIYKFAEDEPVNYVIFRSTDDDRVAAILRKLESLSAKKYELKYFDILKNLDKIGVLGEHKN